MRRRSSCRRRNTSIDTRDLSRDYLHAGVLTFHRPVIYRSPDADKTLEPAELAPNTTAYPADTTVKPTLMKQLILDT
jgi:hypothetical protein